MINAMIVDDSQTVRELLRILLECDESIKVIATADSGEEAFRILKTKTPDIITMDLHMPGISGLEVTQRIMSEHPIPIVIVTADKESALQSFKLLEAGAVAVLETPPAPGHPEHKAAAMQLIKTVKSLAGVKLVRRKTAPTRESAKLAYLRPEMQDGITSSQRFVLIGASTGGPQTIRQIVEDLPSDYPLPIICAQHMAQGFMPGFVTWLNEAKTLKAKIAEDGEHLLPGHFYLAPDDFHTGLNANGQVFLASAPKEFGMRPSVAFLFRSAIPFAERIIAVLLTGMGRDGADDMGRLLKGGARTIAQNKASSIVFGMPAEAIALGHAQEVLGTNEIARKLIALENQGLHFSKTAQTIDKR